MYIDTHAHLYYPNFVDDLDSVVENAKSAGVDYIIVPATDLASSASVIQLINKYDSIYGAIGVHPHDSREWKSEYLNFFKDKILSNNKIVAVGEIGLDYYYDFSPKEMQIKAFRDQIELAIELGKPVIVHNRDSDDDVLNIISEYSKHGLKAQLHCFSANEDHISEYVKNGHFISFTGNITFKKLESMRTLASKVPLEHLLLETDSPFMSPIPHRGKRNEPAYINLIASELAKIHGLTVEDIGRITNMNSYKLFNIGNVPKTSFTYKIRNSLYINVTNRCNADCIFCERKNAPFIFGYNLKMSLKEEPNAEKYIELIDDPKLYDEIVFCGYGEPSIRWEVVKQVANYVKSKGGKTRINTNGHGNIINKRDITSEMEGIIDTISISLNAVNCEEYSRLMRVSETHYDEMLSFAKSAKNYVQNVVLSMVDLPGADLSKGREIAESNGVEFRVRDYF